MREEISRHDLLKVGAGTTVAAGLALAGAEVARAAPAGGHGVQIHGEVGVEGFSLMMGVTVAGPNESLSGSGWDFEHNAADPAFTACYYTQEGSIEGDTVHLEGRVLFANDPSSRNTIVTTDASFSTGEITWVFGGFELTGTGTVARV